MILTSYNCITVNLVDTESLTICIVLGGTALMCFAYRTTNKMFLIKYLTLQYLNISLIDDLA